jgi:hypothetical protein
MMMEEWKYDDGGQQQQQESGQLAGYSQREEDEVEMQKTDDVAKQK